jgi:hypothetical protein
MKNLNNIVLLGAGYLAGRMSKKTSPGIGAAKKVSKYDAKIMAKNEGINFNKDFFELSNSEKNILLEIAKKQGYRKSKNAPGSTARMYFEYLDRI